MLEWFEHEVVARVHAAYPLLYVVTHEERRFLAGLHQALSLQSNGRRRELKYWTLTAGWQSWPEGRADGSQDLVTALQAATWSKAVGVLLDASPFLRDPVVIRAFKDAASTAKVEGRTFIIVGPVVNVPPELEKDLVVLDFPLPGKDSLGRILRAVAQDVVNPDTGTTGLELPNDAERLLAEAAMGLTIEEAENAFALAARRHRSFVTPEAVRTVQEEKAQIVRKTGILEYLEPEVDLDKVGGLGNLKTWLSQRSRAFSEEAREFGLPAPRGLLLVGVPGCGKSLTAKAIAASWRLPLIRLDVGRVFGSLVGQSEAQMRSALKIVEAAAPAVLWIDELEKGMAGLASSGATDSGVTARVFGTLLTWMQEKTAPVFVVATANDVSQLPPELLRKGRFDEIFYVDLPTAKEREEILRIHLEKRGRKFSLMELRMLATQAEGYGGSELEEAVIEGLYRAFAKGRNLVAQDVSEALKATTPLAQVMREKIDALRQWVTHRARPAGDYEARSSGQRQIVM